MAKGHPHFAIQPVKPHQRAGMRLHELEHELHSSLARHRSRFISTKSTGPLDLPVQVSQYMTVTATTNTIPVLERVLLSLLNLNPKRYIQFTADFSFVLVVPARPFCQLSTPQLLL
jgi:hypothetical protein